MMVVLTEMRMTKKKKIGSCKEKEKSIMPEQQ
jgi:hypothetical protein